jgi:hypothetical protein
MRVSMVLLVMCAACVVGSEPGPEEGEMLAWAPGGGLAPGLVTGRIYEEIAADPEPFVEDMEALGVRIVRIEIERDTGMDRYRAIVEAAQGRGIEVLALVGVNSVSGVAPPMEHGSIAEFEAVYLSAYLAALDRVIAELPSVRFLEIMNEPDVYEFTPMFNYHADRPPESRCEAAEGSYRYALLVTRVFETLDQRRAAGSGSPSVVGFDFSRHDDDCLRNSVMNAEPIRNHRLYYRPGRGLPDGPPVDILSIHGYGNLGVRPDSAGYTYGGGTFADGVAGLLAARFGDGASIAANLPVWYTEIGYGRQVMSATDQAESLTHVYQVLSGHPQVTAAFWYVYRDDEGGGEGNLNGLRGNAGSGFAEQPAYTAYQQAAGAL